MNSSQNDLQLQIEKLQTELEIMRKIGTQTGFIQFYFDNLKKEEYKSNRDCFNAINEMYFIYYGEYRYSDFNSFRQVIIRNFKKS